MPRNPPIPTTTLLHPLARRIRTPGLLTSRPFSTTPGYLVNNQRQQQQQQQQTHTTDVLIIGSGTAGLSAALRCHQHGLRPLLVEKSDKVGGTSAWSGGGLWVPCNHVFAQKGAGGGRVADSEQQAMQYLDALIGDDAGPASSSARRLAYVRNASKVVKAFEEEMGCRWVLTKGMPDYHSDLPGAAVAEGRSIEPAIFNAKELGVWRKHLNPPSVFNGPAMHIYEGIEAANFMSARGLRAIARILGRWLGQRLVGREPLGMGQALVGQLLKANLGRGTEIWRETVLKELKVDGGGRVTGATLLRDEKDIEVTAKATVLTAGGFAKNDSLRRKYHQHPIDPAWSSASPHDTGEVMQLAVELGAATALMDQAWWNPSFLNPVTNQSIISFGERGRKHCIVVDASGRRFMNEGASYNDVGREMYKREKEVGKAIPAWLVFDKSFLKHTPLRMLGVRFSEKDGLRSKFLHKADNLGELAQQINVDPPGLVDAVQRFNGFAREGKDLDFQRGETALERIGYEGSKGNPSLGALERPPFYAVRLYPGDIGTKGGLLTDEHARVLREDGEVLKGLYAAGNTSASVMGTRYAGAGATLGPAMVFAALAVDFIAGKPWDGKEG